jgi:type IV fimbrial biogenesis protein FimT
MAVPNGPSSRGVALIELLVTVSIVAIVLTLALPAFAKMVRDNRIAAASNTLLGTFQTARSEAVRRGHRVTVCVSTDHIACVDRDPPPPGIGWHHGWLTFADTNGNTLLDPDEEILAVGQRIDGLEAIGNNPLRTFVSFTPTGQPRTPNNAPQFGTILICAGDAGRRIVLNMPGRAHLDAGICPPPG